MSKYTRTIKGVQIDVYDILKAWEVQNPALQHLIKKALQPGARGHKTLENDLTDILVSAHRAIELEGFKSRNIEKPHKAGLQSPQIVDPIHKTRETDPGIPGYDWARHEIS